MDWLTALSIVTILAGATITVVVLAAVGSIRRALNEGTARQAQQIRKLAETVASLNLQQQEAKARIDHLTDANRKLKEEMTALGERLGDPDSSVSRSGPVRLLH